MIFVICNFFYKLQICVFTCTCLLRLKFKKMTYVLCRFPISPYSQISSHYSLYCYTNICKKLWLIRHTLSIKRNITSSEWHSLKDLCNAIACWLVLIYNTLIITNVAKILFKYVPYHKKSSKPRFLRWHHLSITIQ